MSTKKAKAKGKATAKKTKAKRSAPKAKKGKDIVEVRENIKHLVKESAELIASKVIEVAKMGQLASAKYLFEATGLYPATEQTEPRPIETSLAHTLLTRMGLPLEPVICDEDAPPAMASAAGESAANVGADPEEHEDEQGLDAECAEKDRGVRGEDTVE